MKIERLTPILNVSNIVESFDWFEKLGWQKGSMNHGTCASFICGIPTDTRFA